MNSIRLNGENPELIDSIVRLSLRYGIITPYTSFLIEEDDIFTEQGVQNAATRAEEDFGTLNEGYVGADAVSAADEAAELEKSEVAVAPMQFATASPGVIAGGETNLESQSGQSGDALRVVGDRTFVWRNETWIDTTYDADLMTPTEITFLSDDYFALLDEHPEIGVYLSLGEHLIFVIDGEAYEIKP